MEKILKTLNGYSGSKIYLMSDDNKVFIRKIDNVDRNYERLIELKKLKYNVPSVYKKDNNVLDMEYIKGLDIKTYLSINNIDLLLNYIFDLIDNFSKISKEKDYTETYNKKLSWIDESKVFPFTKKELIASLPPILPSSIYHGDLTLENIIYDTNTFYLIDCMTSDYDSWIFDLAKMRQDSNCFWFIRSTEDKNLKKYLSIIDDKIVKKYPILKNNSLLILMLLRVYLYTKDGSEDQKFILKEIKRLWK
jgi:tRNA A-37 threonylcarbamoyl transferase component Bud32